MPICQSCANKWTWKQTIKTLFRLKCPHCGKKQYESASSRKRTSMISLIPLITLPLNVLFNLPWWMVVVFMIPMLAISWILIPLKMEISNEEEALW